MQRCIQKIVTYCDEVHLYLKDPLQEPTELSKGILDEFRELSFDKEGKLKDSEEFRDLKNRIETTKAAVLEKIKSLSISSENQDQLIALYMINRTLYQLHIFLSVDQKKLLKKALGHILTALPKQLQQFRSDSLKEIKQLEKRSTVARFCQILVIVIACFCFLLAFHYPGLVTVLVPLPLILFVFVIPSLNFWIRNIEDKKESIHLKMKEENTVFDQAMAFLNAKNAIEHLFVLFDEPTLDAEYQKKYLAMLIDLGAAIAMIDTDADHIENIVGLYEEALDDAYTISPTLYEPEFLKDFRSTFEKMQIELKEYFGKQSKQFCKKTTKNPMYFILCFKDFLRSNLAKTLRFFLNRL